MGRANARPMTGSPDSHQIAAGSVMGFAALYPSYGTEPNNCRVGKAQRAHHHEHGAEW
jgi:hypothetical protein